MSKSATSVLAIFVFFWLAILGSLYSRPATRIVGICLAFCSVLAVVFIVTNPDLIYELFGKDQTLTGRTLIWPYVIAHILEKPLLGWGYLAFWSALNPVALEIASATWNTVKIANAHNALLEFLLEIGIVGTCFFIFLWLRNFVFAVKCMNGPASRFGLSSLLLLTAILLTGTSEQVLLTGGQIWTILFFTTGFMCEKSLWLTRAARTQGRLRPRSMPAAIVPKSVFKEPS
jgi:O-antigen ligase